MSCLSFASRSATLLLLTLFLMTACGGSDRPPTAPQGNAGDEFMCRGASETIDSSEETEPEVMCPEGHLELFCYGNWAATCTADGELRELVNCAERDEVCFGRRCDDEDDCASCLTCKPNSVICGEDGARERCLPDGSGYETDTACDEAGGLFCDVVSGECSDLCAEAEESRSYIGCEYWAVPTLNSQLDLREQDADGICLPFPFAVVIANPQGIDAHVRVETAIGTALDLTVEAGDVATVELPCSLELKGNFAEDPLSTPPIAGAHSITSDVPVTVYQFNPLEFESEIDGVTEYSHTNDASLLLPVSALTGSYMVVSAPTLQHRYEFADDPGETVDSMGPAFVAVVGVEDEPTEVEIESSAHTLPSADGSIPALAPGDTHTLTLARGEVVQILSAAPTTCDGEPEDPLPGGTITYCRVPAEYDLTGTRVRARTASGDPARVMVVGGHDCAFVPYNRWACDHLEEVMMPIEAWGQEIVLSLSETPDCKETVPNMARVVATRDETHVSVSPAVVEPVTLNAGQFIEFEIEEDVRINGSQPILVAQFLLAQDYEGTEGASSSAKGDPSLSLGIPLEQWRDNYAVLSPATFTDNYVNITARKNQLVTIDGRVVTGFTDVEGTQLVTARVAVEGGQHQLLSPEPFGIVVYGFARYTSFMVPGGLDLNLINGPD